MSLSRKLMKIKEEVAEATANKTRAEGALESSMKRLKTDFECGSIKAAEKTLARLEEQSEQAEQDLTEAVADLETRYADI